MYYYEKDFQIHRRKFSELQNFHFREYSSNLNIIEDSSDSHKRISSLKYILQSYGRRYCVNTTVHGCRYIGLRELHWTERILWFILVAVAVIAYIYTCALIEARFSSTLLTTVIESITYPVTQISFPAVTVCNENRINWNRIQDAQKHFLPNADRPSVDAFYKIVRSFEVIENGAMEDFNLTKDQVTPAIKKLNLYKLLDFMVPSCEETFPNSTKCWWRTKYYPCCSLFSKHKSEYGICYTFNSMLNDVGKFTQSIRRDFPRRTSNYGEWSGLRFSVNTSSANRVPMSRIHSGYKILIHDPEVWPNFAYTVPAGSTTNVVVKTIFTYTTAGVENLTPHQRQCIYEKELSENGGATLPGLLYIKFNCISECRQRFMLEKCGCTLEFLFPIGNYTPCDIYGLICLNKYRNTLKMNKPDTTNLYFNATTEDGIFCSCLPACDRVRYEVYIHPVTYNNYDPEIILFDVHFQYSNMIKYRTDVAYGFLDMLVGFGGLAGLLLGASVLSIVEILYYPTVGLLFHSRHYESRKRQMNSRDPISGRKTYSPSQNLINYF